MIEPGLADEKSAWDRYWSGTAGAAGCLPKLARQGSPLEPIWREFALALPPHATVLDLGTGDGAVLALLHAARDDLALCGVDYARQLPPLSVPAKLYPNTRLECLPFSDREFDSVVSQFGIEYAERSSAAAELVRVLAIDGRFRLVLHHVDSPILRHNRSRLDALCWAVGESGPIAGGRQWLQCSTEPDAGAQLLEVAKRARELHPRQSVGEEISVAVIAATRTLQTSGAHAVSARLGELERRAKDEIARLRALERAALSDEDAVDMAARLQHLGCRVTEMRAVHMPGDSRVVAWRLDGARIG